ncbi:reverse transcriptase domain-containing protein [Tanacetum coccineum]
MTTPVEKRNHAKFYEFHGEVWHNTDECMHLRKQIEEMLKVGKLSHLIKELKQNNGKEQPKVAKKGEASRKDKALAILMVQPWERVARQRITHSFSPNPEIFFPPLGEDEGTKGTMIIEAKIRGHYIHRMYVDGGSASEILYEHCFSRLRSEIKNQLMPATTLLIGFSGEIIWPIGQIQLLVKIRDEEHSTSAWMNFVVVRSPSSYNGIIGRPEVIKLQAVPSTTHGMLKLPVEGGVITLKSSRLIPLECAMVSEPEGTPPATKPIVEERVKVAINLEYPEQTVMIGSTLTEEGRNKLCGLLQRNLDIFAWKPANMIEEEAEKLVDAGIMKEVHYHDWLSNPVMIKKHDDSWRILPVGILLVLITSISVVPIFSLHQNRDQLRKGWLRPRRSHIVSPIQKSFPTPYLEDEGTEGLIIIEAEIGGHCIHRMYVDGGSASEILGEIIWPIGQIQLLVKIGDEEHSASAWMNFVVLRLVPLECTMVSGLEGTSTATKPIMEERVKVVINPEYPEQTVIIGSTLTEEGHNKLCGILQRNLDIFAWKPADMTGVPRHIEEVRKLVEARIMKEVHYHDWLSNLVMVKKHDDSWRMCVDFKDLSIACPKDGYPLPEIDWKKSDFHWTAKAKEAFKQIKQLIDELPMLTAPMEKEELIVYLAAAKETVSAVLMIEREAKQMPVYFVNRALRGPKINYTSMEKLVMALVHASKRLNRYFQAHPIIVIMDQPIQQVLSRLEVAGRLQKWSIKLGEYAIHYRPRVSVKGQILADFIIEQPEENFLDTLIEVEEELPEPWILFTDGSSCTDGSRAGLILTNPEGMEFTYALRFRFDATNNEAEYEALIVGLRIAKQMGVKNLQANVDSRLVANQVNGTYVAKEADMIRYLEKVKTLTSSFKAHFLEGPGKVKFLIVAIDYFTKWIEAKPDVTITGNQIKKFVWKNIVCIFGLPGEIISDNGKQFQDNPFKDWCEKLCIRQHFTFVKHPQTNGLVERENRSLGEGIKARLKARSNNWMEELSHVLWAHRTMIKTSNEDTPFSLTYGIEAVIPAEIKEIKQQYLRQRVKKKMEKYYNSKVRSTSFKPGDLVYRNNDASHAEDTRKLGSKWEGLYEVTEALGKGAYKLRDRDGKQLMWTWNISNLKKCYIHKM